MRLAIIHHTATKNNEYSDFIYELIENKANEDLYTIAEWDEKFPKAEFQQHNFSITNIVIDAKSSLALGWFYNIKLPSILKSLNASLVINMNAIIHSAIKIPQVILINSASYLLEKSACNNSIELFANRCFINNQKSKATFIISSQFQESKINTPLKREHCNTIHFSIKKDHKIFNWPEKLMIKAKETGNTEFFLAILENDDINFFLILMKAFSKFKKWQKSSMQFLILKKEGMFSDEINEKLSTYKFKNDVKLIEVSHERQNEIIAASYAYIYAPGYSSGILETLYAMNNEVPIISFEHEETNEYCGDAALYIPEFNAETLGEAMLLIYKNENIKTQKSKAGKNRSILFDYEESKKLLWNLLQTSPLNQFQ